MLSLQQDGNHSEAHMVVADIRERERVQAEQKERSIIQSPGCIKLLHLC
jgi:hypothetical protein